MKFVTDLNSALVVERAGLSQLDSTNMTSTLDHIYGQGKPVIIVDSAAKFFSNANLLATMNDPELHDHFSLILEKRGIDLEEEDLDTLSSFSALKQRIIDALMDSPVPYTFAAVPANWKLLDEIVFNSKSIRRSANSSYTIGYRTLQMLWEKASPVWAGLEDRVESVYVRASGYERYANIKENQIEIGCQNIQRFELEQIALHLDWDFPQEKF
jgi:hypothetical protein